MASTCLWHSHTECLLLTVSQTVHPYIVFLYCSCQTTGLSHLANTCRMCGDTEFFFFFTLRSHLKIHKQKEDKKQSESRRETEEVRKRGESGRKKQKVPSGVFARYKQTHSGVLRLSKHEPRGIRHTPKSWTLSNRSNTIHQINNNWVIYWAI